ncbi:hypothetical protein HNR62_000312 [Oceanisphaera litoralis]|nr:hypothetical protein [Oceanisphaera litoralis]
MLLNRVWSRLLFEGAHDSKIGGHCCSFDLEKRPTDQVPMARVGLSVGVNRRKQGRGRGTRLWAGSWPRFSVLFQILVPTIPPILGVLKISGQRQTQAQQGLQSFWPPIPLWSPIFSSSPGNHFFILCKFFPGDVGKNTQYRWPKCPEPRKPSNGAGFRWAVSQKIGGHGFRDHTKWPRIFYCWPVSEVICVYV